VEGVYWPAALRAKKGKALRLVFDRRDKPPCSEEVVIGGLGIRRVPAALREDER
jgi:plastocyanin domain-containing protein